MWCHWEVPRRSHLLVRFSLQNQRVIIFFPPCKKTMPKKLRGHTFSSPFSVFFFFLIRKLNDFCWLTGPEVQRDYLGLRDRVASNFQEWQEIVDEWKGSLLRRLEDLGKELVELRKNDHHLRQILEEKVGSGKCKNGWNRGT